MMSGCSARCDAYLELQVSEAHRAFPAALCPLHYALKVVAVPVQAQHA